MGLKDVGVKLVVEGAAQFKQQMDNADSQVGGFKDSIMKNSKKIGLGMTAMGGAITGLGIKAMQSFADFESGMREVNTMMGLSEDEFQAMSDQVRALAKDMGVDAVEATGALYQAISAGVPKENALTFLEVASKAAIGGVTDTETAVDGLTSVINAFKIPVEDAEKVADILFTTVKGGKTTFEELSASIFNVAPMAATAGVKFEEIAGALATMTKQGVPTSVATTQLRAAIQAIIKPSEAMRRAVMELGYESGQAMLQSMSFQDALTLLTQKAGGSTDVLGAMFGSVEGLSSVLALTGENAAMFSQDVANAYNSAGASVQAFDEINKSSSRQWSQLQSQLKDIVLEVGQKLIPAMKPLMDIISKVIGKVSAWMDKNPQLVQTILKIVAVVGGLMAVLGPLMMMLPGIGAAFAVLTGPIGIVIAAIAGLIAIGFAVKNNWEKIKAFFIKLWEGMKTAAENVFKGIATVVLAPVVGILKFIRKIASGFARLPGIGKGAQDLIAGIDNALAQIGKVTFFAEGGISKGGMAVVGERGPELVSLPPGAMVRPIETNYNYEVTANYTNPQEPQGIKMDLEALRMMTVG